jgi:hypothetical protein
VGGKRENTRSKEHRVFLLGVNTRGEKASFEISFGASYDAMKRSTFASLRVKHFP